jgi:hypothetical protein
VVASAVQIPLQPVGLQLTEKNVIQNLNVE